MKNLIIFVLTASLWTSANCVTFSCKFQKSGWSIVGPLYTCYHPTVLLSNETELQQVTGEHEIGKSDANVEALDVYDTNCPFIPTKIEKFFPNLLAISFHKTNLKVLTNTDLQPFPMLKYFDSWENLIESLDGDVFDNNTKLKYVSFSSNKLVNVGWNLLDKLTNLGIAYFEDNTCINFNAWKPAQIDELKELLIDQCRPKATTITSITSAPTCEEILLCETQFSYLIDSIVAASQTQKQVTEIQQQIEQNLKKEKEQAEKINALQDLHKFEIDELKTELATMSYLKDANLKKALEIVELLGENEATKTQMKKLENQIEVIQRLIDNLNMRFQE